MLALWIPLWLGSRCAFNLFSYLLPSYVPSLITFRRKEILGASFAGNSPLRARLETYECNKVYEYGSFINRSAVCTQKFGNTRVNHSLLSVEFVRL